MSTAVSNLIFRPLTSADREQVMGELSRGIYAGHDYLSVDLALLWRLGLTNVDFRPMIYEYWLHDGRHVFIGAFETNSDGSEGRLLGLDTISLFDEGWLVEIIAQPKAQLKTLIPISTH